MPDEPHAAVSLPASLVAEIDALVAAGRFPDRAAAIAAAVGDLRIVFEHYQGYTIAELRALLSEVDPNDAGEEIDFDDLDREVRRIRDAFPGV